RCLGMAVHARLGLLLGARLHRPLTGLDPDPRPDRAWQRGPGREIEVEVALLAGLDLRDDLEHGDGVGLELRLAQGEALAVVVGVLALLALGMVARGMLVARVGVRARSGPLAAGRQQERC